jgi:hypothetical protein
MNFLKLLLVLSAAGFAYKYWHEHRAGAEPTAGASATGGAASVRGFVELPAVSGASANAVLVIAAENCPEEAAQRADQLAYRLRSHGVPVTRLHNVSFDIPNGDPAVAQRLMSVMNGDLPIVFVRGRAKPNPSLDDVLAEYRPGGV